MTRGGYPQTTLQLKSKTGCALEGLNPSELLNLGLDPAVKTPSGSSQFVLPEPQELSERIPDLEFIEPIGSGGMGGVFLARQRHLERLVAVKVLPAELGRDSRFAERFAREARALARLVHPGIVTIHDFGQADDLSYLVMEYMDGMSLRELLDAGSITPEDALTMFEQICEAIQYAHDAGIVHRDIKPENILFDRRGHLKIADFGLAKLSHLSTIDATLTGSRQAMGTLHYMAPEQWEKPLSVDHRADIYALGVLLYEMLTGKLPMGSFEPPSEKVVVDSCVDDAVVRAMQREPENRFESALAMIAAVNPKLRSNSVPVTVNTGTYDNRGTFTKMVNIGQPAVSFARRMVGAIKESTRSNDKGKWRFPFGTAVATFAVFWLTVAPWLYRKDGRYHGIEGFFSSMEFLGILFDNYLPFVAMIGILFTSFFYRVAPVRSTLIGIVFAAYGIVHIVMFFVGEQYGLPYPRHGSTLQRSAAPLVVGMILACMLLDRIWQFISIIAYKGFDELPKVFRRKRD